MILDNSCKYIAIISERYTTFEQYVCNVSLIFNSNIYKIIFRKIKNKYLVLTTLTDMCRLFHVIILNNLSCSFHIFRILVTETLDLQNILKRGVLNRDFVAILTYLISSNLYTNTQSEDLSRIIILHQYLRLLTNKDFKDGVQKSVSF